MIELKEIAEITMGQSPLSETYNYEKKGLPFFQGKADFGEIYPTAKVWCNFPKKIAEKNDILLSVRAPVGNVNLASENCCIGRGLASIRAIQNKCYYKYLYYLLISRYGELNSKATGSTFKAIGKEDLMSVKCYIPSLGEQKQIAEELDKIYNLISTNKKQIELLNELVKSKFVEMFGSVELNDKKFKKQEIGCIADISSSKRIYANEYQEIGIPFYRSKEIIELGHNKKPSIELFISKNRYEEIKNKYGTPKKGDILITAVGTIGETWIVDTEEPFYYKDGNVLQIRLNTDISQIYFKYVLDTLISIFKNKNVSGSSYSALTIEKFKKMEIILPPIKLQYEFADIVKQIEKQKMNYENNLKKLEELRENLMNKYFN